MERVPVRHAYRIGKRAIPCCIGLLTLRSERHFCNDLLASFDRRNTVRIFRRNRQAEFFRDSFGLAQIENTVVAEQESLPGFIFASFFVLHLIRRTLPKSD